MIEYLDEKYKDINIPLFSTVGSHQFKTATEDSDFDMTGIFVPKSKLFYNEKSIVGIDEVEIVKIIEEKEITYNNVKHDIKLFNIIRFYKLIKFGNIDCITFLNSENFTRYDPRMENLVKFKNKLITKQAVSSTLYYGLTQVQNLKKNRNFTKQYHIDRISKYGYDTKMAAHSVRLIEYGKYMVENGSCDPSYNFEFIKSIREGQYTKEYIIDYVEKKQQEYRIKMENSSLPEEVSNDLTDIIRVIIEKFDVA